jgi:hypothetical protein
MPLDKLIQLGEFHVSTGTNLSQQMLLLSRGSKLRGNVRILVGPYVGPLIYSFEAVKKSWTSPSTFALRDLMRASLPEDLVPIEGKRILDEITKEDVVSELDRVEKKPTSDQVEFIKVMSKKHFCRAAAGSGKTLMAGAVMAAASKKQVPRADGKCGKQIVCVPNRRQRDESIIANREIAPNPLSVIGFGRPADASPSLDD